MEITLIILQHRINISFIFLTLISHMSNYCIKTDNIL